MTEKRKESFLLRIFKILLDAYGTRNWWPGESALEIMLGCILTQNTAWKNVEKAISRMKEKNLVDLYALQTIDIQDLATIIKPAGFYWQKAKRIKAFVDFVIKEFCGNIEGMKKMYTWDLRERLLSLNGIGPETADSILLYALEKPVFVVDAYTRRFLENHGLMSGNAKYEQIQRFFMENLPEDTYIYNEFHALIVYLCQKQCKKVPLCKECPLEKEKSFQFTNCQNIY